MTRLLAPLFAALTLFACSNSDVVATAPIPATAVAVDPAEFLGGVACLDAPGAMRRYVATLMDVSPRGNVFAEKDAGTGVQITLPSSAPTPCYEEVQFERIVIGREYIAKVDGYDRTDIRPLAAGSPVMVSTEDGTYVPPRWTTSCGEGARAATADAGKVPVTPRTQPGSADAGLGYFDCVGSGYRDGGAPVLDGPVCADIEETIVVRGCAPLRSNGSAPSPTGITVALTDALSGQTCDASGTRSFIATLRGKSSAAREAPCDGSAEFDGLTAGEGYTFDVEARSADAGASTLVTTCFATAVAGVIVPAACDPFVELHGG